ncbi:hypothetical protein SUGI_0596190 [Cryptomeria japonica]|nr:hypothetical protein SUGI_0596190 [Cryptomeria japonica]
MVALCFLFLNQMGAWARASLTCHLNRFGISPGQLNTLNSYYVDPPTLGVFKPLITILANIHPRQEKIPNYPTEVQSNQASIHRSAINSKYNSNPFMAIFEIAAILKNINKNRGKWEHNSKLKPFSSFPSCCSEATGIIDATKTE